MKALGLIEAVGLPAAVEAADVAVKSANVSLIGYENTKGGGLITVKLEGDVGAVKAAVDAAVVAAGKVHKVFSAKVIARPSKEIEKIIYKTEQPVEPPPAPEQPRDTPPESTQDIPLEPSPEPPLENQNDETAHEENEEPPKPKKPSPRKKK